MRFGFDIAKLADRDGLGTYVRELARALLDALEEGESLWLYGPVGTPGTDEIGRHLNLEGSITDDPRLAMGSDNPSADCLAIYHTTSWVLPPWNRGKRQENAQPEATVATALLYTVYDLTVLSHPSCHTLDNRIHCLEGMLRARLAGSHFLAISETTADALTHWLGVPVDDQTVIYPAAGPHFQSDTVDDAAESSRQEARQQVAHRFELSGAPVLAVGTIEPRKNLLGLLDAYARLPESLRQEHPLVLAGGEGWHDPKPLAEQLARPELAGVRRLGRVSDTDLLSLYRAAAVFAYPSLAEGFGLPIVEAMASGTPVLTSLGGATEETAGDAALRVDPEDPEAIAAGLSRLLTDHSLRATLRSRGLERARRFSWGRTAKETLALYRRLASASHSH